MACHLTTVRTAIIKRQEVKSAGKAVEKRNPSTLLVGL